MFAMSKAVIFFAPGLEECEGLLCVDILRRAGVEVTIAAVGGQKIVTSARGIHVVADALAEELDYAAFDACILPGGIPGVPNLKADATVKKVCQDFAAGGKLVAAICAAPTALAAFGVRCLIVLPCSIYPAMLVGERNRWRKLAVCGALLLLGMALELTLVPRLVQWALGTLS